MSSTKHKLRLAGAFAALATLALAVSCTGFFQNPTIQSIALQPATPSLATGATQQMQAWETDSDNNRSLLTSGVAWEITGVTATNGGTVMTITPGGLVTATSVGSATIQASAQGITGSTTATVVELTSSMTITPLTSEITDNGTDYQAYLIKDADGNNISSLVTLTPEQNNTAVQNFTCGYETQATDGMQDCTPGSGLVPTGSQNFAIVVTYSGYTGTTPVSATLTVDAP
ncbi:MAG: Ig-like domain-containing protein [Candidatus Sulfotelmatobacter sp.]